MTRAGRDGKFILLACCCLALLGTLALAHRGSARPNTVVIAKSARATATAPPTAVRRTATASFTASTTTVPNAFLGVSLEYWEIPRIADNAKLFAHLVNLLRPGANDRFYIRVGGDSADDTVWQTKTSPAPAWDYGIGAIWVKKLAKVVKATHAKLIVDLNLYDENPAEAATQAKAILAGLPADTVSYFEIGNEPDLYGDGATLIPPHRAHIAYAAKVASYYSRLANFTPADYDYWFALYRQALQKVAPNIPLAGPAVASPNGTATWIKSLLAIKHSNLGLITLHHYPLNECVPSDASNYPTIKHLLAADTSANASVRGVERVATAAQIPVRLTEVNSVTCGGNRRTSRSFATALWSLNTMFSYLRVGVSGVNLHIRTDAVNSPFGLTRYRLHAENLLYGLILFDRAISPGATLLKTNLHGDHKDLSVWDLTHQAGIRIVAVNTGSDAVSLKLNTPNYGSLQAQRLTAPGVASRSGTKLAGQRLDSRGYWHGHFTATVIFPTTKANKTTYRITVPRYSAVLLSN